MISLGNECDWRVAGAGLGSLRGSECFRDLA
jgi:hypothetical protein